MAEESNCFSCVTLHQKPGVSGLLYCSLGLGSRESSEVARCTSVVDPRFLELKDDMIQVPVADLGIKPPLPALSSNSRMPDPDSCKMPRTHSPTMRAKSLARLGRPWSAARQLAGAGGQPGLHADHFRRLGRMLTQLQEAGLAGAGGTCEWTNTQACDV